MAERFTIKINSILGGESPMTHLSNENQFSGSIGIDPGLPAFDNYEPFPQASGIIRPVCAEASTGEPITGPPLWMVKQPKNSNDVFIYDSRGSVYTSNWSTVTGETDLNDEQTSHANGCAYYDNYMYFSTDTDVARYGPLNGAAAWTDKYWTSTLGKAALTDNENKYPWQYWSGEYLPNHLLHSHSDGRLYILDTVDNTGTLHFIATKKTAVEGDTDNGSTYDKVHVGWGLWPTAIESYGESLAIAFWDEDVTNNQQRAKIAFWDTTSQNINQITWVEFPDNIVYALKNVNGVLYAFCGSIGVVGMRVVRFVGGYTYEEVFYSENLNPVLPGAIDGESGRLFFGTFAETPITQGIYPQDKTNTAFGAGVVMSIGLQKSNLSNGLFTIMGATQSDYVVTSLARSQNTYQYAYNLPYCGITTGNNGEDKNGMMGPGVLAFGSGDYSKSPIAWRTRLFTIGQRFKILKIQIPLADEVRANTIITPYIYFDDNFFYDGTAPYERQPTTLATINNANYSGERLINIYPDAATGQSNFFIELNFTGAQNTPVSLPITIEYELIDD